MSEPGDDILVKEAQGGNRQSFTMLVERHYGFMFKIAWQWCGIRSDAEDIAQDAAMKLANHIDAFRFESNFTTWLYRLVINTAKDYTKTKNRHRNREEPLLEDGLYVCERASPEENISHKDILKALSQLPETLRQTIVLVCWQGLSHQEAANILDCSEGTISWRLHEARKKITAYLEEQGRR